jgi:DNA-directed RNA polymerase I subunit RPA12
MGWPFCDRCGTILDPPADDNEVSCENCHLKVNFEREHGGSTVVTESAPHAQAEWAKDAGEGDGTSNANSNRHATIEEPCPKCGHGEMYFYTMQLRSVDEGQTVFYECIKCAHKFSVNN